MTDRNHPSDNFAGFVLVIGFVSIAFGAVFQLAFNYPVAILLNAVVIGVGMLSVVIGLALDAFGYFESEEKNDTVDSDKIEDNTSESVSESNEPLPPVLNFDSELQEIYEFYDNDPPDQFVSFREEYDKMKSSSGKRGSIASDLRASANPLSVLAEGTEIEDQVGTIEDRLFSYIEGSDSDFLHLSEWQFYVDGEEATVEEAQGDKARVKAKIRNEGDATNAQLYVRFKDSGGVKVRDANLPLGEVVEGNTKELDTHVYVPSLATQADAYALATPDDVEVLDM